MKATDPAPALLPVVGHELIHERFLQAMASRRLHHAWLLYGMQGIGKAMVAKQLAAAYLCERNRQYQGVAACGECHACHMLAAGSHPDFRYVGRLEGKRDISVDQVREMLSFLSLSGMESERVVLMLDDADSMNNQAANALLKSLEEPADNSLLIIVCHDLMRLPATIRSRCMLEHGSPLSPETLKHVLEQWHMKDATHELAMSLADGRPGKVHLLAEPDVAQALLKLQTLVMQGEAMDIGALQDWLASHIKKIPHSLISDTIVHAMQSRLVRQDHFQQAQEMQKALWDIAAWPQAVVRHSLRAAPALLGHLLELRTACR